jgi:hypothetical protein
VYAAGHGRGGAAIPADVRFVLELHDIDPNTPASQIAPSTVLYDGVMAAGPQTCTYALLNASRMYADIAFTRLTRTVNAEVRTACPGDPFRTRLAGSLANGAECHITSEPALQFFPEYVPAKDESIVVRYRGHGVPVVQVADAADILSRRRAGDDGVRGAVRVVKSPPVRTAADCHNAALAILDDSVHPGWSGQYATWSDFLPSPDIFPGDAIHVNAPSRAAIFDAIVQEVEIEIRDVAGEHSIYVISFADEAACSNAFSFESSSAVLAAANAAIAVTDVLADLTAAQVTAVSSTAIDIDLGCWPAAGGGIEVRSSDAAWGQENDRNLIARVNTRLFSVPRLGRSQTCFLRQYDSVGRYSRYSTALHVDCPLS